MEESLWVKLNLPIARMKKSEKDTGIRLSTLSEPGGIEAFVKDGILAEDGVCDNCGYILPEGTELEEVE